MDISEFGVLIISGLFRWGMEKSKVEELILSWFIDQSEPGLTLLSFDWGNELSTLGEL
jgi:hypothetical protein